MIAYVTSIGESTTDLCVWSLRRNGFEVIKLESQMPLWTKLAYIYNNIDEDFLRVDADVIPNSYLIPEVAKASLPKDKWWCQFMTFDWYKFAPTHGGVQFIKKEALPALREHIDKHDRSERPESQMFRLPEFHNPRRCITNSKIVGVHGYGQKDIERVKQTKDRRNQLYDWEMFERLSEL